MTNRSLFALVLIFSTFELFSQDRKSQPPSSSDTTKRPVKVARGKQTIPQPGRSSSRIGSQIVDDTTKSIYGPQTTLWTTEREIFTGRRTYATLDSSILNFHRWTYVQQFQNFYQDLGNNGTALYSIFPTLNSETVGARPGFSAYELYFRTEEPKLFNSKSPYTRMYGVWGGAGRAATGVEYSRNINPKWNFSFNYHPILTDKQILRQGKGDRHVISHYYDISSHYATPKEKYEAFASYRRIRHRVNENGGISFVIPTGQDSSYNDFFGTVSPVLIAAISLEQRNQFHLFHQYILGNAQVYHIADIGKQVNWYKDDLIREVNDFYDNIEIDSPKTVLDSVRFSFHQHQVGFKGQLGKSRSLFYNGYYKVKLYNQFYNYLNVDTIALAGKSAEHFVGAMAQYNLDSIQSVSFWSEFLAGGYFRLEAEAHTRWLDFTARKLISKPTFLQTAYSGHFDLWSNDFSATESLQATVFPKIVFGPLFVSPGVTFTSLNHYIYFKQADYPNTLQKVLPVQARSKIELATGELRMDLAVIKKIHLRPQLLYTHILSNPENAVRIPVLFMNGQLSLEDEWFKGNLQVHLGFDFHWHSAYQAMGYDPAIQSFYNQDEVITPAYLLGDVFFNGKMKRGRFFVKYHNFFQLFTQVGQMPTPYYRATKNILDFGFDLLLFD